MTLDLEALVPYPLREEDVTADSFGRWLTGAALRRHLADLQPTRQAWEDAGQPGTGPLRDAYERADGAFRAEYALAYLLRELPMSAANRLAREVWLAYDTDGVAAAGELTEWLGEDGLNVEAILTAIRDGLRTVPTAGVP